MAGKSGTRTKTSTSQTAHAPKKPRGRPRKKTAENSLQEIEKQFDSDSNESLRVQSQRKMTKIHDARKKNSVESVKSTGIN